MLSDGKGALKQVSHLINKNKLIQATLDTLLEREKARNNTLNAIKTYLDALCTIRYAG